MQAAYDHMHMRHMIYTIACKLHTIVGGGRHWKTLVPVVIYEYL